MVSISLREVVLPLCVSVCPGTGLHNQVGYSFPLQGMDII